MYGKGDEKPAANLIVKQRKAAHWNNRYIELKQQNNSTLYLASGSQLAAGCNLTNEFGHTAEIHVESTYAMFHLAKSIASQ